MDVYIYIRLFTNLPPNRNNNIITFKFISMRYSVVAVYGEILYCTSYNIKYAGYHVILLSPAIPAKRAVPGPRSEIPCAIKNNHVYKIWYIEFVHYFRL